MVELLTSLHVAVKIIVLILGSIVALLAYRAYRRTQMDGLQYFSIGLSVITIGTFLVGILHHMVGVSLNVELLLESLIVCIGFVIMIYALYG
jgi:uncharacterized membrane protein